MVGTVTSTNTPRTIPVFAQTLRALSTGAGVDLSAIQPKTNASSRVRRFASSHVVLR